MSALALAPWSALAIYERHKEELSTISYRQFLRYVSEWRPPKPKGPARSQATQPRQVAPVAQPERADYAPVQSLPDAKPRERKRMVLHSPVPLAEGEPAPNDGSRLPAPLRPEPK
jgi:hypothetical protein